MVKYKCGHEGEVIILNNNELSINAFLMWKDEGNKQCWECYCKEDKLARDKLSQIKEQK